MDNNYGITVGVELVTLPDGTVVGEVAFVIGVARFSFIANEDVARELAKGSFDDMFLNLATELHTRNSKLTIATSLPNTK